MTDPDDDLEARLTAAFDREANAITPGSRLADIQAAVPQRRRRPTWGVPLAAAAAVAAIAVVAWVGLRPPAGDVATPAGTTATSGVTSARSTSEAVLPVFFVAPQAAGQYRLIRQPTVVLVPDGSVPTERADAALRAAMSSVNPNPNGYVSAWPPGLSASVVAHPGVEIDVLVDGPGTAGLPDEVQRLAVQALVWTVTEAYGDPTAPVAVVVRTGGPIFDTAPGSIYKRPADDRLAGEIAQVWVDHPATGTSVRSGSSVTVDGTACTFEQTFQWELRDATHVVRQGVVTAGPASCPQQRGAWSVDVGTLPAGSYQFAASVPSAENGQVIAHTVVLFTVA